MKNSKKGYLPAWIILLLSLSFTAFLWHNTRSEISRNARADFDFRVEEIKQTIAHRMRGYEQVLKGGVGLFNASEEVTSLEWREYVKSLRIEKSYPGIQGIGFSVLVSPSERDRHIRRMRSEGLQNYALWPEGDRPMHTAIIYLEPLDWRNRRAIGYDMYSEPVRKQAMDKAVENDMAAISGKVTLVQETSKDVQAGFLMYLPVYRAGTAVSTPTSRRGALLGYVYSPFRMRDFMQGIIGRDIPDLNVEIFDGEAVSEESLMYDSDQKSHFSENGEAVFEKTVKMEINGHLWTMHFSTLPPFEKTIDGEKPVMVLTTGMLISLLFSAIAFFLASHRARLKAVNEDLNCEVAERKRAEEELMEARDVLETRVKERTEELTQTNETLHKEISVRKQAEAALRQSEERFRALVETTNDWVWEMDASFRYTYASPMVLRTLGYGPGEMAGTTPFDRMNGEDAARLRAALTELAASKMPFTLENRSLRKDGSVAIIETSGAPIIGSSGEFLGYRGIDRDATERKRIEREKESMQTQLIQSQKMELMGRLAGGVAHDFNNIMTIITSLNNLAMKEASSGQVRDYLDQIQAASERAANLTRQLLIFSRNQPTKAATLDVNRTAEELLSLLRNIIGENIVINSDLAHDLLPVEADNSNIEQLFMNLVINSKDAMPNGGQIVIKTGNETIDGKRAAHLELAPGEYVCITISDSGAGMDEDVLKRVFEPFFSTKEPGKGIGLGLTVVHNIVAEYKGGITVESRPGQGTVFKVFLPASRSGAVQVHSRDLEEPLGNGETILLIEDELMLSRSVSLVLTKSGYKVFAARDGEEAVKIFEREGGRLDLVFSDVVLKGKSGVNIVDEFLALKPDLKVIFASGYMDIEAQWPYIKEKGFRFLQKPYDIPELLRAVRDCLNGAR